MSEIDPENPRWQLVQQVVHSPQFEKSPRLRSFLTFICERALTGQQSDINEQEIGVHVFGRPAGYNPGDDSIVRSQARILRQRLAEYFIGPGRGSTLRIEIPKGTYVPTFSTMESVPTHDSTSQSKNVHGSTGKRGPNFLTTVLIVAALLVATVSVGGYYLWRNRQKIIPETEFWNTFFDTNRRAIIVPADSTLVLIEEATGTRVSFEQYLSRKYLSSPALQRFGGNLTVNELDQSRYTSMADLSLVARLMHLPQIRRSAEIRYARDLSISDAREDNLILIGGSRANPWVQLFAPKLNFTVEYDWQRKSNEVINKAPVQGESALYLENSTTPESLVYGVVAYEPSLEGEGSSLLVAGTSSAGTQAAADFLVSNRLFADFLRRVQQPNGAIPHFEILLGAHEVNGTAVDSRILASRLKP